MTSVHFTCLLLSVAVPQCEVHRDVEASEGDMALKIKLNLKCKRDHKTKKRKPLGGAE